jgi:hypothetical protein
MRYTITIAGNLNTWADEATVRRDFSMFVRDIEAVHYGIESGSVTLVSVEALPEVEPAAEDTVEGPTADLSAVLAGLNAITARLDKAGL